MKELEFFFDLSSPYSYLAATQLDALARRTAATIRWRPMVLGAVFKANGIFMPAQVPAKGRYMAVDLARWARHYNVPFHFSSHFPVNAIKAERLILVAERERPSAVGALTQAAFAAIWAEDRDVTDVAVLAALATGAGLDPAQALLAIEEPAIKARLRELTDQAIARGIFGAPTLVVDDELFWGNDRLQFVEAALRG